MSFMKRVLAFILSLCMVISLIPATAFAEDEEPLSTEECEHFNVTFVDAAPVTCTEDGNEAYFFCNDCGLYSADESFEGVVYDDNSAFIISAEGHQWGEGVETTPPTCTEEGVKTFTCTVDGCGETKTEPIPATGHEYTDGDTGTVKTPAICVDNEVRTFTCANCNQEYDVEIPTPLLANTTLILTESALYAEYSSIRLHTIWTAANGRQQARTFLHTSVRIRQQVLVE